ncbi:Crp/Fnr family transcriptional regulator [Nitratireductor indicus]|uniref:Cyclic nucleotide-binding protein n=1 Tax=Nitratireductor indicus C115 TaxID=1231190 RepID=K2P3K3_9HYPH|nr:Crp/Fnr family transcriptional regulator [Nitratireductor indicus]EKF41971.1 cyclic nucleotide-binding protein [Nitratireductor indicus C115]MDS1136620.1 Crp/Fnr family transcriptional regulator [Nitratireductor indicus]SFQ47607.1 cAMP-binding domain of CRP or a regulatory subunit of cAMP-dependent protein kinases [Nitratireductor indicus]
MTSETIELHKSLPCTQCPLRSVENFRDFEEDELTFVGRFKKGDLAVKKGATLLVEGAHNPHLYTVLSGWGFRYKLLSDGRRQIVNYVMPGDLVGLQGSLTGEMQHSVEALSSMVLCVFEKAELFSLYERFPALAYDITWMASREECMLDENLLTVGRRTALEKVAYLLVFLLDRGRRSGMTQKPVLSITQQHVADTLGISVVHTNKTIAKLAKRRLLEWEDGGCRITDPEALAELAGWSAGKEARRPFL